MENLSGKEAELAKIHVMLERIWDPNPKDNFKKLKEHRNKLFKEKLNKHMESNGGVLSKQQTYNFKLLWLEKELQIIEYWLTNNNPDGSAKHRESDKNKIEIIKYRFYV